MFGDVLERLPSKLMREKSDAEEQQGNPRQGVSAMKAAKSIVEEAKAVFAAHCQKSLALNTGV